MAISAGAGGPVGVTRPELVARLASCRDAMELAGEAAAIVIGAMGTATVKLLQLENALNALGPPGR